MKGAVFAMLPGMEVGPIPPSGRTRVRREAERGLYDRATIDAILDEALVCHVGFVHDEQPFVIPTLHARVGDELLLHGSSASRMLRAAGAGAPICVTVTLVDGLVLARSAFNHSVNYRSVVVLGVPRVVDDPGERERALEVFTERIVPGRWADVRHPSPKELKATRVLSLTLDEASAKVRTGGPNDDDDDLDWPAWAGVLPLTSEYGALQPHDALPEGLEPPGYLTRYRRPRP